MHNSATDRRCARLQSKTPAARKPALLTTLSSSLKCESAAEHHTAEQYSKTGMINCSKTISEGATDHEIPEILSHDTKPLSCSTGNKAKVLLKGHLSIKRYPNITRSADSFRTVPSWVDGVNWVLTVRDLETIIVLVLLAFRLLLGTWFSVFVLPVFEYCSSVWCSAADTHLKLLDRAVSGASFLTRGVLECDFAHRRSVAVLCMLYKIRCNQMHPLYAALSVPYVPVRLHAEPWSHTGTVMCLLAAEPRSIAGLLFPCQYLCGTFLVAPYSMVRDWRVSRARPMPFYWPSCSHPFCLLMFSPFHLSLFGLLLWVWDLLTDMVLIDLTQPCITDLF